MEAFTSASEQDVKEFTEAYLTAFSVATAAPSVSAYVPEFAKIKFSLLQVRESFRRWIDTGDVLPGVLLEYALNLRYLVPRVYIFLELAALMAEEYGKPEYLDQVLRFVPAVNSPLHGFFICIACCEHLVSVLYPPRDSGHRVLDVGDAMRLARGFRDCFTRAVRHASSLWNPSGQRDTVYSVTEGDMLCFMLSSVIGQLVKAQRAAGSVGGPGNAGESRDSAVSGVVREAGSRSEEGEFGGSERKQEGSPASPAEDPAGATLEGQSDPAVLGALKAPDDAAEVTRQFAGSSKVPAWPSVAGEAVFLPDDFVFAEILALLQVAASSPIKQLIVIIYNSLAAYLPSDFLLRESFFSPLFERLCGLVEEGQATLTKECERCLSKYCKRLLLERREKEVVTLVSAELRAKNSAGKLTIRSLSMYLTALSGLVPRPAVSSPGAESVSQSDPDEDPSLDELQLDPQPGSQLDSDSAPSVSRPGAEPRRSDPQRARSAALAARFAAGAESLGLILDPLLIETFSCIYKVLTTRPDLLARPHDISKALQLTVALSRSGDYIRYVLTQGINDLQCVLNLICDQFVQASVVTRLAAGVDKQIGELKDEVPFTFLYNLLQLITVYLRKTGKPFRAPLDTVMKLLFAMPATRLAEAGGQISELPSILPGEFEAFHAEVRDLDPESFPTVFVGLILSLRRAVEASVAVPGSSTSASAEFSHLLNAMIEGINLESVATRKPALEQFLGAFSSLFVEGRAGALPGLDLELVRQKILQLSMDGNAAAVSESLPFILAPMPNHDQERAAALLDVVEAVRGAREYTEAQAHAMVLKTFTSLAKSFQHGTAPAALAYAQAHRRELEDALADDSGDVETYMFETRAALELECARDLLKALTAPSSGEDAVK